MNKRGLGILVFSVILGMLAGSVLGEVIGLVCPEGVVRDFFLKSVAPAFGPLTVNLLVVSFTLGISIKLNFISLLGVGVAVYYFRWYK